MLAGLPPLSPLAWTRALCRVVGCAVRGEPWRVARREVERIARGCRERPTVAQWRELRRRHREANKRPANNVLPKNRRRA